jgi:twitching motility protein PilU
MDFKAYLRTMVERDASDLYLSSGAPASAKIDGTLQPLEDTRLDTEQIRHIAYALMDSEQSADFEHKPEMNLAISEEGIGRFRVNIFRQRNSISLVIRNIKTDIPDWKLLGLPAIPNHCKISTAGAPSPARVSYIAPGTALLQFGF